MDADHSEIDSQMLSNLVGYFQALDPTRRRHLLGRAFELHWEQNKQAG